MTQPYLSLIFIKEIHFNYKNPLSVIRNSSLYCLINNEISISIQTVDNNLVEWIIMKHMFIYDMHCFCLPPIREPSITCPSYWAYNIPQQQSAIVVQLLHEGYLLVRFCFHQTMPSKLILPPNMQPKKISVLNKNCLLWFQDNQTSTM